VDHNTSYEEQSMQFSRDDVAQILAIVLLHVLEVLHVQHVVEGIAILPAGNSTYLVDLVLRELSTKEMQGVSITIPPTEE
jgi:hypothetical protein